MRPRSRTPSYPHDGPNVGWIKHVIYPHRPVEGHQLERELVASNPNYARISAAPPRMLSSKVAVLNFLPGQIIPEEVVVFGSCLTLKHYRPLGRPNPNSNGGPSRGAHNQPAHTNQRSKTHARARGQREYNQSSVVGGAVSEW